MRTVALGIALLAIVAFFSAGCDPSGSNPTGTESTYATATLTHMGFDFSAGQSDTVNYQNNDGETIQWQPDGGDTLYADFTEFIWWRNSLVTGANRTKDLGTVALSTVTSVDTSWDVSPAILPLLVGHTIVAGCNDGFVKFQVISADTSWDGGANLWPAQVRYHYSPTTTFDR